MYEMLLWWSWPCSRGSAWLWQCSHQECTAARRQVGVSLLRGRKPSLVGSVFWPPSRCLRAPSMLHRCSGKRAMENKRGRERVKVCVFCKLSLYRFECMCVCFLCEGKIWKECNYSFTHVHPPEAAAPGPVENRRTAVTHRHWRRERERKRAYGMEGSIKLQQQNT